MQQTTSVFAYSNSRLLICLTTVSVFSCRAIHFLPSRVTSFKKYRVFVLGYINLPGTVNKSLQSSETTVRRECFVIFQSHISVVSDISDKVGNADNLSLN